MKRPLLLQEFLKDRKIGAIARSSSQAVIKAIKRIEFDKARTIVEYGPGTGAITEEIVKRLRNNQKLVLIEQNKRLYVYLREKFRKDNITICNDKAENIERILKRTKIKPDYVISSLPFRLMNIKDIKRIIKSTKKSLSKNGHFIVYEYMSLSPKNNLKELLKEQFKYIKQYWVLANLPPTFIFDCSN